MKLHVYLLLGGLFPGPDGWFDSAGFHFLRAQISTAFPDASVYEYEWSSYEDAANDIKLNPTDRHVIIGYSGGGSRFTWLADQNPKLHIDLAVLYDPSPQWQMKSIASADVDKAVCYQNSAPNFGQYGGGKLVGRKDQIVIVPIAEGHLKVQFDESLHSKTIQYIRDLIAA